MKKNSLGFRLLRLVTFWVTGNLTAIFAIWHAAVGWKILVGILCGILFLFFQFAHVHTMAGEKKLASLAHGCDLLRTSTVWFCLELLTAGALFRGVKLFWVILLIDLGVFSLLCWFTVFQGLLHIALHSTQVKLPWHVALFFLWWVPLLNLFLVGHVYRTAKRELQLEWAPFLMVPETKRRGVSHGDMIDLNRENIPDFDVREWYSQLVQKLKQNGF